MTRCRLEYLVTAYCDVGISKRSAIRYIVDSQMRSSIAHGKGSCAGRRATTIFNRIGREIEELCQRISDNRARWAADAAAEYHSEARRHGRIADRPNINA